MTPVEHTVLIVIATLSILAFIRMIAWVFSKINKISTITIKEDKNDE